MNDEEVLELEKERDWLRRETTDWMDRAMRNADLAKVYKAERDHAQRELDARTEDRNFWRDRCAELETELAQWHPSMGRPESLPHRKPGDLGWPEVPDRMIEPEGAPDG